MLPKPQTCAGCPLYGEGKGFSYPDGEGYYGVLIVAEALGESEEEAGVALVGPAGHFFFSELKQVGLERDGFIIHNTVSCRPPNNKLAGMPYESAAIKHCSPNLDEAIERARSAAAKNGRTFTILTLGKIAFKRVLGIDDAHPILTQDYFNYPFWSDKYRAWVIAATHPAFLIRGNTHLVPVMQFGAKRAVDVAEHGFQPASPQYLLDPPVALFRQWVEDFKEVLAKNADLVLSYDIETPMKQGKAEDEVEQSHEDFTILRCSFSYAPGCGVSVPWTAPYLPLLEELFGLECAKVGWNAEQYDLPRVTRHCPVRGPHFDGMLAWHVLNSTLPKGLGFVAPFYVPSATLWKHLSANSPALYNAIDADYALQCWLGICRGLKEANLWQVFERHIVEVNKVLNYMSQRGVLLDLEMRQRAEDRISQALVQAEQSIQAAVPQDLLPLKIYLKEPRDKTGLVTTVGTRKTTRCPGCGALGVKAAHYKSIGKKRLKTNEAENPCVGLKSERVGVPATLWAKPLPFKLSKQSLQRYQQLMRHVPIFDRKKKGITFDEGAMRRLQKHYPNDPLYPLIVEFRGHQKLLSTYVGRKQEDGTVRGGMIAGADGRIHALFTQNPSTLRTASQNPNMQNLPRPKGPEDEATLIRNMIVAAPDHILYARDFSGIEAVLVGYFAMLKDYIRLAKMDVHSFYTAYALYELDKRIPANDLPLLCWDDSKLAARLAEIKKAFGKERNNLYKHLVHGANFMQGAGGAAEKIFLETGTEYPIHLIKRVMDIYFNLFPGIKLWHSKTLAQAARDGFLRNPFGYVHRFNRVYDWEKVGGKWQKSPGPSANQVIAALPQSTAAAIIKEALLRLFFENFDTAGEWLRLIVHDELLLEPPTDRIEQVDAIVKREMERPIPELALPDSYGMGPCLSILTEAKIGERWGSMKEYRS